MKKIFIKYNPYKLETKITVEGQQLAENSKLREKGESGSRLQEWVEELPGIFMDELNDRDFEVTFHGTILDYEDVVDAFQTAERDGKLHVSLKRESGEEIGDKEAAIDAIFQDIQKGPFDELRDEAVLNAFRNAKSSDFEVCVVATMSAGKSTLINALIQDKLMPSKQEACTAIITRIKDDDHKNWKAEVYGKDGELLEAEENLNYETMNRLNSDEAVSEIRVNGDIPFVTAEDVSLVLIDTPGPNNARNAEHRAVQERFLSKSSKSLILYIMEGTFGSDADDRLLSSVAKSMSVGGKQSKDRFIFVVNKMDDRRQEDGETSETLERVRNYLENHEIKNPNLFPAAALPALNIRLMEKGAMIDEDTIDETEVKVRKLNRKEALHFERYSPLPASIRGKIKGDLAKAESEKNENQQALIHTGIPSVEAAIRQYVQKYAKTAKIKNIVDTFAHKLEEVGCFEETKRDIAEKKDQKDQILEQISAIRKKVGDAKTAQKFESSIKESLRTVAEKSEKVVKGICGRYQEHITKKIDELRGKEIDPAYAQNEANGIQFFAKELEPKFKAELDELIQENLISTGNKLLESYRKKLSSLTEEMEGISPSGISIDPMSFMSGSVDISSVDVQNFLHEKTVEDGEEWVENTDKAWWKFWTWFQEDGYYRTRYKTVQYVNANEIAQEVLSPIQEGIQENGKNALKHANDQAKKLASVFQKMFEKLDEILNQKLAELEKCATDEQEAELRIQEATLRLEWLNGIKRRVDSILEI